MRALTWIHGGLLCLALAALPGSAAAEDCKFARGDINSSGVVDLNDAVLLIAYLFEGEIIPPCRDAADMNDNGIVEMSDYTYLARYLFADGPPPPPPFKQQGITEADKAVDPTPGITVPAERDARFTFKIGEAIGYASNTGLKIPLYISNADAIGGFQMVFQYDGTLLRIDEMRPEKTKLADANPEYVLHRAYNRPGVSFATYCCLVDFATPIDFHTFPAGDNQLVGNIVVSISLIADPCVTPLTFVDGIFFPEMDPPSTLAQVENFVTYNDNVVRPQLTDGQVTIRKAFIRGDSNQDKRIDIADCVYTLQYIFLGGRSPKCLDAADVNNDTRLDISDPIFLIQYMFLGGPQPSSPFPMPGVDPDFRNLGCAEGLL